MKEVNFKREQLFNACTPHIHHCYCKGPGKTSSSINTWECCCNLHHSVASKASKGGPKKWKTPPFSFHYLYLVIYYIFFFFDLSSLSFVSLNNCRNRLKNAIPSSSVSFFFFFSSPVLVSHWYLKASKILWFGLQVFDVFVLICVR